MIVAVLAGGSEARRPHRSAFAEQIGVEIGVGMQRGDASGITDSGRAEDDRAVRASDRGAGEWDTVTNSSTRGLPGTPPASGGCRPASRGVRAWSNGGRVYMPMVPSIRSRRRSACPLWRAYSSIM
ncbi:hypothetical protein Pa4123_38800 [Phytohabitans aurantiacus]|uniref:Uncharacterized protein n=1 Tax=Phytohabitans aurantiacus TaxID=3016789 RepID=A0ABQ5QVL1_9ACTN|nr:hypothetical protein Pa4123_38800 [Phytohabitans aurantiacus]